MRARNLKPAFFKDDDLAELPFEGRLLYQGLWCMADREGKLEDRPKRIKAEVFPYDSINVETQLRALVSVGLIVRYEVAGERYISIPTFLRHQKPHRNEAPSCIPDPSTSDQGTKQDVPRTEADTTKDSTARAECGMRNDECGMRNDDPPEGASAPPETPQAMVAFAVDFCREHGYHLANDVKGHLAREIGKQFKAGRDPVLIRDGISELLELNKSPARLPWVMGDIQRRRNGGGSAAHGRDRVAANSGRAEDGEW